MIEFLQDYETKAIPPEVFEAGDRETRSDESELYFVKLGVAAFVTKAGLVDIDHRPITVEPVAEVVVPGERRALLTGRAGELPLGVDAPQRATTGPGNAALFGGDQQTAAAAAEFEALRGDFDRLTGEYAALEAEHATSGESLTTVTTERDDARKALETVTAERDQLKADLANANAEGDDLAKRVETLEAELASAKGGTGNAGDGGAGEADGSAEKAGMKRGK